MSRPIALLDRDGTIIYNRHYLSDPEDLEFLPGAVEGLRRLRDRGWLFVLITNQSGIGRGYFDEARLGEIHERFEAMLAAEELRLEGIFYCPHTPDDDCACRKPRTGMVDRAVRELDLDLSRAAMIGDSAGDMGLAANLSIPGVFIRGEYDLPAGIEPAARVSDLVEAAAFLERLE